MQIGGKFFSFSHSRLPTKWYRATLPFLMHKAATRFWMLTTLALGLLVGGVVAPWVASYQKNQPEEDVVAWAAEAEWELPQAPRPEVPFAASLRADGYVELMARHVPVPVKRPGTVKEVTAKPGQYYEEGDLLVMLEGNDEELERARLRHRAAKALLARTEAELKTERIKESEFAERYERVRELVAMEAASPAEMEQFSYQLRLSRARIEELKAQRQLHRAQLEELATQLSHQQLRAPVGGYVWSVLAEPGMYFEPGKDFPTLIISPDTQKVVRVLVPEAEAARLQPRQQAVAFLPGEGGAMLELAYVRTEPEVELQVRLGEEPARFIQVVFRVIGDEVPLVVGQKLEVYLEVQALSARASSSPAAG